LKSCPAIAIAVNPPNEWPATPIRVEVEFALQRELRVGVERRQRVDRERHVARPVDRALQERRGTLERVQLVRAVLVLPHGVVAAGVLEVDRDVTLRRPVPAEIRVAVARPAKAVAEDDHR
jgi:hypothetical protein